MAGKVGCDGRGLLRAGLLLGSYQQNVVSVYGYTPQA